jgi:hypothetical protein
VTYGVELLQLTRDRAAGDSAVSVDQNVQEPKIDGCVLWDQDLRLVFDAYSPVAPTGIDELKHLYVICIHIIFRIFIIHRANRPWLKVEVVHVTK